MNKIQIQGEFIRLDAFLKFSSLVSSGGEAKIRILQGEVLVNGTPCTQRGKKCRSGDLISMDGQQFQIQCS